MEGGFRRYKGQRVVCEDGRCVVYDDRGGCAGGCCVMRGCNLHYIRDYVRDVEK